MGKLRAVVPLSALGKLRQGEGFGASSGTLSPRPQAELETLALPRRLLREPQGTADALASSVRGLSGGRVARARACVDELLEPVLRAAPLPWLVGPFAPVLGERPAPPPDLEALVDEVVGGPDPRWARLDPPAQRGDALGLPGGVPEEEPEGPSRPRHALMPQLDF
ncbi:hypothetical protein HPG69_007573 [Diceros bicornis minor]|uniref:Uncharacterized protein n=1 Tax=Diceros bicornis minor TaxID=77932 RepID=A0A7J7EZC5_DICBM|nr:hypothetical protein HPG69_007573 [Diceros bicornis minor]